MVSAGVQYLPGTISIELLGKGVDLLSAGFACPLKDGVGVGNMQIEHNGRSA
jgi:hypothetical protein